MQQFTYFTNKPRGCLVGLTFGGPLHVQVHEWLINAGSRVKIRVDVDQLVRPARPTGSSWLRPLPSVVLRSESAVGPRREGAADEDS